METKLAYLFPGQGAQTIGMGHSLYESSPAARAVFQEADSILGFALSRLCFEGPQEELSQTINTQPAIVTTSLATLRALEEAFPPGAMPHPAYLAGHSIGEYTALAASEALEDSQAIYLARERGRLMHQASLKNPGGMLAIIGLNEAQLEEICHTAGVYMANINCPSQIVLSGAKENLSEAAHLAKTRGALRVIPLEVSGAFHTPLMNVISEEFEKIVYQTPFKEAGIPIIANTSALPIKSASEIKTELSRQLCQGVQWQKSVEYMLAQGVNTFVEIGPGRVLTGLVRRINSEVKLFNLSDEASIMEFVRVWPTLG